MQKLSRVVLLLTVLVMTGPTAWANDYSDAIKSFSNAGASGEFFKTAYGYAVFPTIGKAGFVVGGAYGKGLAFVAAKQVGSVEMTQLTAGFQLGGQAFSQIIFFEHEQAFRDFSTGNFEFSAQATAVAITAGVSAEANTGGGTSAGISGGRNDANVVHGGYRKGMAVFTIAKGGLMGEAVLGGQKYNYTPMSSAAVTTEAAPVSAETTSASDEAVPVVVTDAAPAEVVQP